MSEDTEIPVAVVVLVGRLEIENVLLREQLAKSPKEPPEGSG